MSKTITRVLVAIVAALSFVLAPAAVLPGHAEGAAVTVTPVVVVSQKPDGSYVTVSAYTVGGQQTQAAETTTAEEKKPGAGWIGGALLFFLGVLVGGALMRLLGNRGERPASPARAAAAGATAATVAGTTATTARKVGRDEDLLADDEDDDLDGEAPQGRLHV